MYLIGLSGKKRHGKDAVAEIIESMFPVGTVHRVAFADALKEELCAAVGVSRDYLNSNKELFRHLMQAWGEFRRANNGQDYWVDKAIRTIAHLPHTVNIVLITDTRHINEANMIKSVDGFIFRINRPMEDQVWDNHISETALDNYEFDEVINNAGSLVDLKLAVIEALARKHIVKLLIKK